MKRSRIAAALVAVAAIASPAVADIPAGVPDALSPDPVVRGALIAMPAVWNVQVRAHLTALRLKNGQTVTLPPDARTVQKEGTAFAVTPDGFLLSALHVVSPPPAEIAATAYLEKMAITGQPHSEQIAADWVKRTGARAGRGARHRGVTPRGGDRCPARSGGGARPEHRRRPVNRPRPR